MADTTERMAVFAPYAPPERGAVDRLLTAADRIAANAAAIKQIRALITTEPTPGPHASVADQHRAQLTTTIRDILQRHHL